MKIYDFELIAEKISPLKLQEEWDNSGWQLKLKNDEITNILVAMEVTEEVIREAVIQNVDLILTHHPLIFGGINTIDINDVTGKYIDLLIKNNISVYSMHTNFDIVEGGNNDYFGQLLGFEKIGLMDGDDLEMARMGTLPHPMTVNELISHIEYRLRISRNFYSFSGSKDLVVNKVAWCTGGGSDFMKLAYLNSCDLFITGDVKYHVAQNAKAMGIAVLDVGHFASENIFTDNMYELFKTQWNIMYKELDNCSDCNIIKSRVNLNPFSEI